MSQEQLLDAIGQQARRQVEEILEEARRTADKLARRAEEDTAAIRDTVIEKARTSVRGEAGQIVNEARLAASRQFVSLRHEAVTGVLDRLRETIKSLPKSPAWPDIVNGLLAEALRDADGEVTVQCRPGDRAIVEAYLKKRGAPYVIKEADFPLGGVVASWDGGRLTRHNTFESRLAKIRSELLREAGRLLFADNGPENA
jgi:V/A-type H+-transporting ATPase subunit E